MAIRIYALSKDLKIDSKELVDICTAAGVIGKGSALASLTDEEVARVKTYLAGGRSAPRGHAGTPHHGPVPILASPAPTPAPAKPAPPAAPTPPEAPAPAAPVTARGERPAETAPTAPVTPTPPSPGGATPSARPSPLGSSPLAAAMAGQSSAGFNRQDYIPPTGGSGGMRILGKKAPGEPRKKAEGDEGKPASRTVVKLAAIPKGSSAGGPPKAHEPAPQKPILTLPRDAIRGAKSGTRPPLEHLTKTNEKGGKAEVKRPNAASPLGHSMDRAARAKLGKASPQDVEMAEMADMASVRALREKNRREKKKITLDGEEDDGTIRRAGKGIKRAGSKSTAPRKDRAVVQLPCTVRSFSEGTGVGNMQIQKVLMGLGILANINAIIEPETAELIAQALELDVEFRKPESPEETLVRQLNEQVDPPEKLAPRPPVVTFLGHVDHGKTSLLDRIIGTNVVAGEAGGITQHIRAYQIEKDGRKISFVDTPGHEAFTEMRARGANVTDIAVLVVAADDGIMPQTEEAISHARAAKVPIVVACNKIDLPGADPERVKQQLSAQNLLVSEWGGDVEFVPCSALKGTGMNELLETLLLTADVHQLTANADRPAVGTCLEASQQPGAGVTAKMMVRNGTLRLGDIIVCGAAHGRVKAMVDPLNKSKKVEAAGPSTPVDITGLDIAPSAGERFYVLADIGQAREIAVGRAEKSRATSLGGRVVKVSFEEFQRRLVEGELDKAVEAVTLNLILRADVRGSIEAIQKELEKLHHPEVRLNLLQASVGGISVADVTLAGASDAVIVGFNVAPDEAARALADERGVEIRRYDIIYKVADDIRALLEGRLKPEEREIELGRVLVKQVFSISRVGTVAGCQVLDGTVERSSKARVIRDSRVVGEYPLDTLRREKEDVRSVAKGMECGIKLANFNDIKIGDILEIYRLEEFARTLSG